MSRLRLVVEGTPGPKGSTVPGKRRDGGIYTRPASKLTKPWELAVSTAVADALVEMLEPPYRVTLHFRVPRPKKPTWRWPVTHDLDKLARCTIDGLQKGGAILDDKHVVEIWTTKRYAPGPARCRVTVCSVGLER